jgi:hypothetical protein
MFMEEVDSMEDDFYFLVVSSSTIRADQESEDFEGVLKEWRTMHQ